MSARATLLAVVLSVGSTATASSAKTSSFVAGGSATESAVRVEPPFGFRNSCPFRLAIDAQLPEPRIAMHRFDGDSSNDRRVEVQDSDPNILLNESGPLLLEPNCRYAVLLPGGEVVRIDLSTGATTTVDSVGEMLVGDAFFGIDMLQDGRAVGIDAGPLGIRVIDAVTGDIVSETGPGAPFDVGAQVSDDARFIVAQDVFDRVEVYDAVVGRVIHRWAADGELLLSPSGRQIAIVDSSGVTVHDQAGQVLDRLDFSSDGARAQFAMDDTMVICRSDGAYRWDLGSELELIEALDTNEPSPGLSCGTVTF